MRYPGYWTEIQELRLVDRRGLLSLSLGCIFCGLVIASAAFLAIAIAHIHLSLWVGGLIEAAAVAIPFLFVILQAVWALVVKPALGRALLIGWRYLRRDRRCVECDGSGMLSAIGPCSLCDGWALEHPFDRKRALGLDDEALEILAEMVAREEPCELDEERYAELNPTGEVLDDLTYTHYRAILTGITERLDALEESGLLRSHYVFRTMPGPGDFKRNCRERVATESAATFLAELREQRRGLKPRARTAALAE